MPFSINVEAELKIALSEGGDLVLAGFMFRSKDEQGNSFLEDLSTGEIKGLTLKTVSKMYPSLKRSVKTNVEKRGKGRGRKIETSVEQRVEYCVNIIFE